MGVREGYSIPNGPGVGGSGGASIGSGYASGVFSLSPLTEIVLTLTP